MPPSANHIPGIREWDTPQGWHVAELHYSCDPAQRGPNWAEETRKALGYSQVDWDREMEIDWTAGLGACYFDKEVLHNHYSRKAGGPSYRGVMLEEGKAPVFETRAGGPVWVWRLPERVAGPRNRRKHYNRYCIGADVAEGLEKGDASAAYVVDRLRYELVAAVHCRLSPDRFAEMLNLLGRYYSEPDLGPYEVAMLGVESNNHGHTVLSDLSTKHKYPRLFAQVRGQSAERRLGWFTSSKTKPVMVDYLAKVIREKELVLHDKALVGEMLTFIQAANGDLGATGGDHDDRVMAAAIALQMHKLSPAVRPYVVERGGVLADLRRSGSGEAAAWVAV